MIPPLTSSLKIKPLSSPTRFNSATTQAGTNNDTETTIVVTVTGTNDTPEITIDAGNDTGSTTEDHTNSFSISGLYEVDDTVSATIDGHTVTYTTIADDLTANGDGSGGNASDAQALANIAAKLAAAINADGTTAAQVTASSNDSSVLLFANTEGDTFTLTTSASNGASPTTELAKITVDPALRPPGASVLFGGITRTFSFDLSGSPNAMKLFKASRQMAITTASCLSPSRPAAMTSSSALTTLASTTSKPSSSISAPTTPPATAQ